jgi:hypothetical protein
MKQLCSSEAAAFGRYECTLTKTGKRVNSPVARYFEFSGGKVIHYIGVLDAGALPRRRQV